MLFRCDIDLSASIGQFLMILPIFEDKIEPKIPENSKRTTNAIEKVGKNTTIRAVFGTVSNMRLETRVGNSYIIGS